MNDLLNIVIDGKPYTCEKGEMLLDVCKRNGIFIPTLCNHDGLGGIGACRLCIVDVIEGNRSKVVVSCIYPVTSEIEVLTQSASIREQRATILALLHHLAPNSEMITQMAAFMKGDSPRLRDKPDGDRCILCGRCTSACEQLGTGAIAKVDRGTTKKIATPFDDQSPECIGCGACAHVCPTDAISYVLDSDSVTIWGKRFELVNCDACGKPFATVEQLEYLQDSQQASAEIAWGGNYCEECARKEVANLQISVKQILQL
jgi:NADH dehydrogenase/NADH:ubiquinone oxidoreductase subunit G